MEIRAAQKGDEMGIYKLIKALAEYEKEPEAVTNTPEQLASDLFDQKYCDALVAEENDEIVGFSLYYTSYSTWKGACLYLEDFFVQPAFRGKGIGSALFDRVVAIARERRVPRMEWQVLEWNQLAIDFYEHKKATLDSEWLNGRFFFEYSEE